MRWEKKESPSSYGRIIAGARPQARFTWPRDASVGRRVNESHVGRYNAVFIAAADRTPIGMLMLLHVPLFFSLSVSLAVILSFAWNVLFLRFSLKNRCRFFFV